MTDEELALSIEDALREVHDPEVGLNIVDMGLVYDVSLTKETGVVEVQMTLTTPTCPAGEAILEGVERRLSRVEGVKEVVLDVTFEPPWTPEKISPKGRALLGW